MGAPVFVDAVGAVRDWVNGRLDLVGPGRPLPLGVHLQRLRSPYRGAYVYLTAQTSRVGTLAAEGGSLARVAGQVYGLTDQDAADAAVAYANLLADVAGPVEVAGGGWLLMGVDAITGPAYAPDRDEPRVLVDADFHLHPNTVVVS